MKKTGGQSTIEHLIILGAVIAFLIGFMITGFPTIRTTGGVIRVVQGQSPFQRIFLSLLQEPGEFVTNQVITNTRINSYGTPSSPIPISNPTLNFTGVTPGQYPSCYNSSSTPCLTTGPPPTLLAGEGYRIGECYTGDWDGRIPSVCTPQGIYCVCSITGPYANRACCIDETNDPLPFINYLGTVATCPAVTSQVGDDTCGGPTGAEPDHPSLNALTPCYPGMTYTCWEVACIQLEVEFINTVYYIEFEKDCVTGAIQDTCPGNDAGVPYQCQPNDNFAAPCTDFYGSQAFGSTYLQTQNVIPSEKGVGFLIPETNRSDASYWDPTARIEVQQRIVDCHSVIP